MPAISAYAPGKIILFGEHAVVYNQPAIAIPVNQVKANVKIFATPLAQTGLVEINAPGINLNCKLSDLPEVHPFQIIFQLLIKYFNLSHFPAHKLKITSDIPISAGLGSGTAVSVAMIRALSILVGKKMAPAEISSIAFEVEKIYHGTPSGIDNTVIAFEKPTFFIKNGLREMLEIRHPLTFLIADSGVESKTADVVLNVRKRWSMNQKSYENIFSKIGNLVLTAKEALIHGKEENLGQLMNQNHLLLTSLGVSSPILDKLTQAAINSGALGAKLSGAGIGGNIIALVHPQDTKRISDALLCAGAKRLIITNIHS